MSQATKELLKKHINKIKSIKDLDTLKRTLSKKYGIEILSNAEILEEYKQQLKNQEILKQPVLEKILKKRAIRTLSGIAPVAVLTKSYPCPGNCAYCPNEKDVPVSYLSNEPAVMRAIRCNYHPYRQTQDRLRALEINGHEPNKIELIVMGGTWSFLPLKYRYWYIANCFKAANDFKKKNQSLKANTSLKDLKTILKKEQKRNEKTKYQIIGLTLETRPDYINEEELILMREMGCTRVEMGVQAISDKILDLNRRGHGVKEIVVATKILKNYGFKVTYHFMPALPGSSPAKDFKMFEKMFSKPDFQPDQIKFYPTVVVKGSLLYRWWKQGKYKPYSDKQLKDLIIKCKNIVPKYVRIIRLIRDIPGESIEAGNKITNLRQIMQEKGVKCDCIRCREARDKALPKKLIEETIIYKASEGTEYFISLTDQDKEALYGFLRLRIDKNSPIAKAIIRELHVYGQLVPVGTEKKIQHSGLGKQLIKQAEKIAKEYKAKQIAVISGVGVRGYYRKVGYKLKDTYMVKNI
ncbi:MAG: tRNA uridine(34) 5-carboxymethylaminomethyl modification radical SAM/GNAT enzyme Elp3 [Candidatus Pacebacteria bacterium]|nr:tRNA uridine(34) 5-carboxymethylaminomethyl modification radical SAM/GNAT enzyme Elp3 [Candidatus Paceibacterota bacterium]